MSGYCGYLATLAGPVDGLNQDVVAMTAKMSKGIQRGLILRNENSNLNYNTDFMQRLFSEEGKGLFSCRSNIIGHMQQGGSPAPFDRNLEKKWVLLNGSVLNSKNVQMPKPRQRAVVCKDCNPFDCKSFIEHQDMLIWRKEDKETGLYAYKGFGTYSDVSAEEFLQVQVDIDHRKVWDPTARELEIIDTHPKCASAKDYHNDVIYWKMLFSNRDYIEDPGINIPAAVTTWVAASELPDFLCRMRQAAKEYKTYVQIQNASDPIYESEETFESKNIDTPPENVKNDDSKIDINEMDSGDSTSTETTLDSEEDSEQVLESDIELSSEQCNHYCNMVGKKNFEIYSTCKIQL
ncbi:uncharacterized protein [Chelonus insularis]|uniref:uncharacterized protein n=1 Tax=Chelonus insularis TaxID=460826 RepID=UPI00158F457D|nr:uncharacterized protein LOC118070604 [Chelonus insularis]